MRFRGLSYLRIAAAALGLAGPVAADPLVIFAAASLKEPLDALAADFGDVTVSYGGSGALARQVSLGAPADVVLLAHRDWMEVLVADGSVRGDTVVTFASNRLVIVGQPGAPLALTAQALLAALDGGRLAMGFTASVPAGIYAKTALERLGLWGVLAPHVAEVDNVRQALALVARGEAPLGIVYASDVRVVPGLDVLAVFPADSHPAIAYQGAVTAQSDDAGAAAFLELLMGPVGQAALAQAGFIGWVAE